MEEKLCLRNVLLVVFTQVDLNKHLKGNNMSQSKMSNSQNRKSYNAQHFT